MPSNPVASETELKLLRLEKITGVESIEEISVPGEQKPFKVAIINDGVEELDVMRMIAECESMEGHEDAFIVVNLTTLYERFKDWKQKIPRAHPFYAIKCNSDALIAKMLADLGAGFDCASDQELMATVGSGITSPEMIIYANTVKQRAFIKLACKLGVRKMTFDNVEELGKIKEAHKNPELILRIRIDDPSALSDLGVKFGADPPLEKGEELLHAAKEAGLPVIGISFHVGSGSKDPQVYCAGIEEARKLFDIGKSIGHDMRFLDLGGGFPDIDTERVAFDDFAKAINAALEKHFPEEQNGNLMVIAEPGRYFGSLLVALVANVIGATKVPASRITKKDEDSDKEGWMYYLNDGVFGSFGALVNEKVSVTGKPLLITKNPAAEKGKGDGEEVQKYPTIIWGPTCAGSDRIEDLSYLRRMGVGDWIYYPNMGAYSRVTSSHFNGFKVPVNYYIMMESTWRLLYDKEKGFREAEWRQEQGKTVEKLKSGEKEEKNGVEKSIDLSELQHKIQTLFE